MAENGVTTSFTYDDCGRTRTKQKTVGATAYTATYGYSFGQKLKSVTSNFPGEEALVQYNCDGLGKRRNKLVNSTDGTWYRWDASFGIIAEYAGDTTWTVGTREMSYTLGGMRALADVPGNNPSADAYRCYAQDHLGSLFDGSKAWAATAEFEPYGAVRLLAGTDAAPGQLFTGKPLDDEVGLYFFPHRYYSPTAARWLIRNPIREHGGANFYLYSGSSPIRLLDLLGLQCTESVTGNAWVAGVSNISSTPGPSRFDPRFCPNGRLGLGLCSEQDTISGDVSLAARCTKIDECCRTTTYTVGVTLHVSMTLHWGWGLTIRPLNWYNGARFVIDTVDRAASALEAYAKALHTVEEICSLLMK